VLLKTKNMGLFKTTDLPFVLDERLSARFSIHHYSMERQDDDQIMIQDGRPFAGPVELIHHHSHFLDGFITKPTIACERPDGLAPLAWPGFTMLELEFELLEEAKKRRIKKVYMPPSALNYYYYYYYYIRLTASFPGQPE